MWDDEIIELGPQDREITPKDVRHTTEEENRREKMGNLGAFATRAELFHQMLMEDFRFMEAARMQSGEYEGATLSTDDLRPMTKVKELMITNPQGLINFAAYSQNAELEEPHKQKKKKKKKTVTNDFRTRRIITRMSKWPPGNIYAHWLLSTSWFRGCMIAVIVLNSLMMAVEGELNPEQNQNHYYVGKVIDSLDFLFLCMFLTEIFLKWVDNFRGFWTDWWNIFDYAVSALSLVAPILDLVTQFTGADSEEDESLAKILEVVKYIRIFRIFRSLNVVTRIRKIMVIWAAITRTFKSLLFITILMAIFFYIFAIIGIQLFDRFTRSHRTDLMYEYCFRDLFMAMVTLFQLFTLDKWYNLLWILGDGMDSMFVPVVFVLLWVLLGSFIFRNIFVGVMVNNFQNIRLELLEEQLEQMGSNKTKLSNDLNIFGLDDLENEIVNKVPDNLTDFEINVFHNMEIIRTSGTDMSPVLWPRDTLFQYFILLEALANNLDERDRIMNLCTEALMRNYDEY